MKTPLVLEDIIELKHQIKKDNTNNDENQENDIEINDDDPQENQILLKIEIQEDDLNKNIYSLGNTDETLNENDKNKLELKHENICELNEDNITLIINRETTPFKNILFQLKMYLYNQICFQE